jgi:hypothetical protein
MCRETRADAGAVGLSGNALSRPFSPVQRLSPGPPDAHRGGDRRRQHGGSDARLYERVRARRSSQIRSQGRRPPAAAVRCGRPQAAVLAGASSPARDLQHAGPPLSRYSDLWPASCRRRRSSSTTELSAVACRLMPGRARLVFRNEGPPPTPAELSALLDDIEAAYRAAFWTNRLGGFTTIGGEFLPDALGPLPPRQDVVGAPVRPWIPLPPPPTMRELELHTDSLSLASPFDFLGSIQGDRGGRRAQHHRVVLCQEPGGPLRHAGSDPAASNPP